MDPPLTPTPGLDGFEARMSPSSSSPSSLRRRAQLSGYPLSTDSRSGNGPMGGRDPGDAPATTSETRLESPAPDGGGKSSKASKRKKNRNRKRRNRQESFLTPGREDSLDHSGTRTTGTGGAQDSMEGELPTAKDRPSFFKLGSNLSNTSIESNALLDHRYVYFSTAPDSCNMMTLTIATQTVSNL